MARTVLLADDSPTIQRVVELTFAGGDLRVVSVSDGGAAIEAIRRSPPDVVLADIGMPGRSGYDVLEFVRSQPALASLPVVLLAGAFETIDQATVARMGGDGVLTKPLDPAVLVGRVSELLAHPRGSGAVRPAPPPAASPSSAPPASGPPPAGSPDVDAAPAVSLQRDRYFEEIDQAFAALSRAPRSLLGPTPTADDAERGEDDRDLRLSATAASPPPGVSPPPAVEPASLPLTDAFAALLDAERSGTPIDALWRPAAEASVADPVDIDRLAELVARRVLEQLSDRALRDTVSQIVSATAERLVREEIERITRHIK